MEKKREREERKMKRRWTAALLALLLLALCGCASQKQEAAEVPPEGPEQTAVPVTTEAEPVPTATEAPAPAASEVPAPAATVTQTADIEEASPAETAAPEEEENIRLTTHWQMAYQELLEDPALLDQVIGQNGDYRKGYFGGWDNSGYLLPFSSYAVADLDGDGVPELLLDSAEMGLVDLIGWNGDYVYIGYDNYLGFLPELGASLVHGHWHGAGGSYTYEYSVSRLPQHELIAYFDHSEPGYDQVVWSFLEEGDSWYSGSAEGDSARYDALVRQYVYPALRVEDLAFYPLDSLRGLAQPQDLSALPTLEQVVRRFPGTCKRFLEEKGWQNLGLNLAEEGLEAALWDLDRDGVQELLLRNRELCVLFRYDGIGDRMEYLGQVQGDIVGVQGHELAVRAEDGWMLYSKRHADFKGGFFTSFSEEYASLIGWVSPNMLASGLL